MVILGVGILNNSCTTYITYPIQTPPSIKTDKDINRIAFINPFFDIETESIEDEDGRSTTNYVDLVVEAGFSLYRSNGDLLDRAMVTEVTHYQSRPALSRFIVIGPSMGKAGVKVNELSGRIGEGYIYNFYPGTESAMRMIYIGGPFSGVTTLMRNHWWEDAIELLMPLASSPDPKIAQKAAHNLAIAYEGMGDRDAYIFWMKKKNK